MPLGHVPTRRCLLTGDAATRCQQPFLLDLICECECGLGTILDVLIEEVAEEELLSRPPGLGDVGRTIRWVNHFGEVESVRVRSFHSNMVAMQNAVNLSAKLLVDSVSGRRSCFETVPLIQSCDLFRCWCVVVIFFKFCLPKERFLL